MDFFPESSTVIMFQFVSHCHQLSSIPHFSCTSLRARLNLALNSFMSSNSGPCLGLLLLRYYGIHDTALLLLKSYLKTRKQYVEFEDTKSEILPITVGVPQGSIRGPLLFIIYINDFSEASSIFKFIMYADDTTLFSNLAYFGNNIETKESLINAELSNVIEWLNINKLSLNKSKSNMIFHVPNKDIQYLTLKIDNVIIEKVDEFNFLGLTMDTNLNWKKHSEKICNNCTKMIGILNRLKYVGLLPLAIKMMLYNTLILPHINYCIMAWGYKGPRLLKIQKKSCSYNNIKWVQFRQ